MCLSGHIPSLELNSVSCSPHLNHPFIGFERGMQTCLESGSYFPVTQTAGCIEIVPGGIPIHAVVGCPPVTIIGVAAVAEDAFQASVNWIVCEPCFIYKHCFVRSQRLHGAASALAFGLGGLQNLVPKLEGDLPSSSDERSAAGVAADALAFTVGPDIEGEQQQNNHADEHVEVFSRTCVIHNHIANPFTIVTDDIPFVNWLIE